MFSVCVDIERAKRGINEAREIRTPNLMVWSQTRCRCAIALEQEVQGYVQDASSKSHGMQSSQIGNKASLIISLLG